MFEYSGAIHIHSKYSDGSGSIPCILEDAKKAELDFITLTDHNTLSARVARWEGWHGNLLLMVGEEVSSRKGHCLALGTKQRVSHRQPPAGIIDDIQIQDGLSFIAHPHGSYRPLIKRKNHAWRDWTITGFTGLELWSYMFDWIKDFHYLRFYQHYRYPERFIEGPNPQTLQLWDQFCQTSRCVAIGGVDAHARKYPIVGFTVFPYEQTFRTLRTHILTHEAFSKNASKDIPIALQSLRQGHCFIGYDFLHNTTHTRFQSVDKTLLMGDEHVFEHPIELEIYVPISADLTVIKDGQPLESLFASKHRFEAKTPGVYRIEARLQNKPWIYTNPIYLRSGAQT
ncbi:MAG: CehA/McbA family metallohydrolase [bacterium]|nr:CehA/McbA family metallohydrolase [bacterium]